MSRPADAWIRDLRLAPHPEGGWFRETYRSAESVEAAALPPRFGGRRAFATAICFLLCTGERSAFHRIRSDEVWHFYAGSPLTLHILEPSGGYVSSRLGDDPGRGESFQVVVPAGHWFGATVEEAGAYALVGCTVAPGFDFADFELARRVDLLASHPQHREIIHWLTKE